MARYLVFSVIAGFACAAVGLWGFGVGLLGVFLSYVVGCWAGFAATVAICMLVGAGNDPEQAELRPEYS